MAPSFAEGMKRSRCHLSEGLFRFSDAKVGTIFGLCKRFSNFFDIYSKNIPKYAFREAKNGLK